MSIFDAIKSLFRKESEERPKSIWCVVATVADTGQAVAGNTPAAQGRGQFAPGTKVYCFPPDPPNRRVRHQNIKVIGRYHGSHEHVTMMISTKHLTDWRAQIVYTPEIIEQMAEHWHSDSEPLARQVAETMRQVAL